MATVATLRQKLDSFKTLLRTSKFPPDSPILDQIADFLLNFTGSVSPGERIEIEQLIATCFTITVEQVRDKLTPTRVTVVPKIQFDELIPAGWFQEYVEGTIDSEPPTVFHFFCAASILGAMTERHIWVSKGHYRVFPNLNIILIAPTGIARKTAAINIALDIAMKAGYEKFILGQTTPEAFIQEIGVNDPASGLVIGREMAAFFKKAKYMDGIIPLFTDLIDCPNEWRSLTVGRGKLVVKNVMLSAMYGTTIDWVNTNMPQDIFGGGFWRRHITVAQDATDRISALPSDMEPAKMRLAERLKILSYPVGEFAFDNEARSWYIDWYAKMKKRRADGSEEQFAGYLESKPDHLLRLAMLIRVSQGLKGLTTESLFAALKILDWTEQFLPATFSAMGSTQLGDNEERIIRYIKSAGGRMPHSVLCRRMSKWLTATKLQEVVNTLKESEMIEEHIKTVMEPRSYYLTPKSGG